MIDWDQITDLKNELGEDGFAEVITLFMEEIDEVIERLEAGQRQQLEQDLHFLKGNALNMGFAELARFCEENEAACRNGLNPVLDLRELLRLYRQSKALFLKDCPRLSAA